MAAVHQAVDRPDISGSRICESKRIIYIDNNNDNSDKNGDNNAIADRPDISGSRICEGKRTPGYNDNI